jgi:hypothetical protein
MLLLFALLFAYPGIDLTMLNQTLRACVTVFFLALITINDYGLSDRMDTREGRYSLESHRKITFK